METLLAWGHFLAGITWIGILYYFNFIQVPFLGKVTPETKAEAFQHLVPNALWWFRWGALATWLFGAALLMNQGRFGSAFALQGQDAVIGMGAWLGTIMLFNVWGIIWPNQKKVLGLKEASADEKKAVRAHGPHGFTYQHDAVDSHVCSSWRRPGMRPVFFERIYSGKGN